MPDEMRSVADIATIKSSLLFLTIKKALPNAKRKANKTTGKDI